MIGLEKITEKILSDARAESERIISEAEQKCQEIARTCQEKKQQIEEKIEAEAIKEGESIKMRALSAVAMNKRDFALKLRADLIDEVFEKALDELLKLDGDKYRELLSSLMAKVLCERVESENESVRLYGENISPEKYEILMNKKDKDTHGKYIIDKVRRATVGKIPSEVMDKVVLSDKSVNIEGGFIIKCGDIELNCSLKMLVCDVRPSLEGEIAEMLFWEHAVETK